MVKLGLIGAGQMGTAHVKSMLGNPLFQVKAVCDINFAAAQKLAELVGAGAYSDMDEMLNRADIDAVIVATPDNLHAEPVMKAAAAKKAILLEKPFATNLEEGKRMLETVEKHGVTLQMAHLLRFLPFYLNIKEAVEAGELGELLSCSVMMLNQISVPAKFLKWAKFSSPSWFMLSHTIDAILWFNGCRAIKVRARGFKRKLVNMGIDTYDLVKVETELENGALCTFEANWIAPDTLPFIASVKMTVSGTEGTMYLDTGDPIERKAIANSYTIPRILEYEIGGYYCGLRRNMLDAFARTLEYGAPLTTTAMDGFNALCVLDAIDRSMLQNGAEITLSY